MTAENIKTSITGWCNDRTGLQLVEDRAESGADFALALRSSSRGSASVPVDVRLDQGDDRVVVSSSSASGADAKAVESVLAARPALVRGESSGGNTVVSASVYTDGFNKQLFIGAVEEVAKTRSLIDALTGATAAREAATPAETAAVSDPFVAQPRYSPEPSQSPAWSPAAVPSQTEQPAASNLPAPSFSSPSPAGGYSPLSGQPAQQQAQPASAAFAPTHTVPPQGMQAWAAPDPAGAVVATLGGGLPIQVTEVRGAWANIVCSNGWTGWVDGRIIGVAR
ncbi:MAG: SH3 domain-containing protein [Candidatus Dormibacter sp.]